MPRRVARVVLDCERYRRLDTILDTLCPRETEKEAWMNPGETSGDGFGASQQNWLRLGGIAAILLAVGYVVIFPLYFRVGVPPSGGDAWFQYLPAKTSLWWAIVAISVITDFLFLPVTLALYLALKRQGKNAMRLAAAFVYAFVSLDLAVTWSHYASILTLYEKYSATSNETLRAGYLAAADYGSAMLASPLEIVYSIVTLSIGILVIGFVMLRGVFSRATAYLGLITGLLGVASLSRASFAIIGNALCATLWLFFVGYQLCRLTPERLMAPANR